ncbi:hypothetical protein E2C01_045466 [Portunus trituberculatus]|uniref:Uncharacterized protein n=1 Tax=Portunus trituberculatus TaxID=210409 RepID=A0A5B7G244_PORTR|nr:hypothetical protein [Portunus trituberculatus]
MCPKRWRWDSQPAGAGPRVVPSPSSWCCCSHALSYPKEVLLFRTEVRSSTAGKTPPHALRTRSLGVVSPSSLPQGEGTPADVTGVADLRTWARLAELFHLRIFFVS